MSSVKMAFNIVPVSVGFLKIPAVLLKWKKEEKELRQSSATTKVYVTPPSSTSASA